jgi:hypothetical protein
MDTKKELMSLISSFKIHGANPGVKMDSPEF